MHTVCRPWLLLLCCVSLELPVGAADWPQFLGSERNGISAETGLLERFPDDGPPVVWRCPGGVGMSGIVIAQGRACTLLQRDGQQWAVCLDALTGDERWAQPLAPAYENSMGDGPRSTPAISENIVCTYTGEGVLSAHQLDDGTKLWSRQPVLELGGKPAEYGMACSPLVHAGLVVITLGAPQATVAAYDLASGELRWQAGEREAAGYSSPTLLTVQGQSQLVVFTGASVCGISPADGRMHWRHPWDTDYACNIAVPLAVDGGVLISCGENHGSALLDIQADGTVQERWTSQGVNSVLRSEWQTGLHLGDALFGYDNVGSAGPVTHLTCIDPRTGTRHWQQKRFGKGNAIAADGKLWCTTMEGELVLVRASADSFAELGRAKVLDSTRQAPSLADGHLYLRDGVEFVCLDVRQR